MAVAVSRKKPENVHDKSLGMISEVKADGTNCWVADSSPTAFEVGPVIVRLIYSAK
ncbi:hypothetical protein ALP99_101504 [Pseudomonas syringae pv. tomato]|uniref:Uncharacterized protein n=5 Tax=Pseudomonas syringae group TaxID=136849 RepID=A0A0P9I0Z7_9PSED|nr:Unknown protein sequence [Pseudomonas amygdali pv. lachrymans]KPW27331.1 hypothetical protein ALO87_101482 [Pseudomonas syringae pv. apii]KPW45078.1 hypothetical protein ALO88_101599 [Pseudomonas syringae pv. antirrhini]KPW45697.1 hypothetical protein ALO86_101232 [Pseudomonas syringae pv. berberidis]KPX68778.1 hypothetical protein ALO84_101297 [Pseudomonas syringae pv. maculicola]KPY28087.1 hypothetical protein ALO54_101380 [Pseudomonas syringae pv. philadelphi]KPY86093.1 hypothetical pro